MAGRASRGHGGERPLDGSQLTRRLRELGETRRMPVILLTARAQEADVACGFDAGADDYVRKPVRPHSAGAMERGEEGRFAPLSLRGYAGLDGRLPNSFDVLIDDVFGDLLEPAPRAS